MSLPEENRTNKGKNHLDLDSGLHLTPEDLLAMKRPRSNQNMDLAAYIEWLEQIGAFKTRKADPKIYPEMFEL